MRLLEDEAKSRGITVAALENTEIDGKILAIPEDQKRAVYETVRSGPPFEAHAKCQSSGRSRLALPGRPLREGSMFTDGRGTGPAFD